jgi:outer membrane autotransporter protein
LLSGTAAVALCIAQPAGAIVINDLTAQQIDSANVYSNVVSLRRLLNDGSVDSGCTGSLINSRTILTAAHCLFGEGNQPVRFTGVSFNFNATGDNGFPLSGSKFNRAWRDPVSDIAVLSLAQPVPVTTAAPVRLLMLQPGQAGFPTIGTTITMVGYGAFGTGSNPPIFWFPKQPGTPPPVDLNEPINNLRRVGMSSLGLYGVPSYFTGVTQPFFVSQFRDPLSPNNPNFFNLQVPVRPLEAGTAPGDSGGPLFAMINGQLTQIGVVRGGDAELFCGDKPCLPGTDPDDPKVTGTLVRDGYGQFSDWTPINLFLQWIDQNNPLRDVTAAAGNFKWSNPAAWTDRVAGVAPAVPNNTVNYIDSEGDIVARYYNVTLSNAGTITLDMNPQIDNLSIMGLQSQLVIGGPYTLQVLLDTRLSAGTLTMLPGGTLATGTYTQTGGLVQYLLAPGGAGRIAVVNSATLGGALGVTVTPGLYGLSTPYTLLSAAAINGQFAQFFSSPSSTFLSLSGPIYTPTSVDVTLTRTPFGAVAGLTANQRAVGNALEAAYATTLTGPAATLYTNLLMTGTPDALTQLSGEVHGSVQAVIVDDSRYIRQAVLGRLRQAPYAGGTGAIAALGSGGPTLAYGESATDAALAYANKKPSFPIKAPPLAAPVETPDLTFWAQGVGAWGKIDGDGNAADASRTLGGVFTGFDRRFNDWRAGLAAGYTNSSVSVSARASSANIDTAYVAAYAGTSFWAWNFRSGATFAWNTIGTSRTIAFPGFLEQATTRYGAGEAQVFGELGYGLTFGAIAAEPFAGLAWVHLDTASFTETGGVSALIGTGNKEDVGYSTLGARVATYYLLQNGMALIPRASVAWQHAFGDVTPTAALSFQSTGSGFNTLGVPIARDAALVEAGGDLQLTAQAKIGVSYAGQLANRAHDHSVKGNFTWRF